MPSECRTCPRAADGPFYTVPQDCLFCEAPHGVAPNLLGWHVEEGPSGGKHCLFKKQPSTPEELEEALAAMHASCINNLLYRGRDAAILKLLERRGLRHLCDHPLPRWWQRLGAWFRALISRT